MTFVPADFWPPGPPTGGAATDQTARDAAAAAQATATAAVSTGAELDALFTGDPAAVLALTKQLRALGYVTVSDPFFGAVGDGSDERAKIQAAVDFVGTAGGGEVRGFRGKTYTVGAHSGTKTFKNPVGADVPSTYCVDIPSNVGLKNLSLKLPAATDATLLCNRNPGAPGTDSNIALENVRVDGNNNVTANPLVFFQNLTDHAAVRCRVKNAHFVAWKASACTDFDYDRCRVDTCQGTGFIIGGNLYDQCSKFKVYLHANDCHTCPENVALPGNGIFIGGQDWTATMLWSEGCDGAHKIGPNCARGTILGWHWGNSALNAAVDTAANPSGRPAGQPSPNSGLKIQGATGAECLDISVGPGTAYNCGGPGLYFSFCQNVQVTGYRGDRNGLSAAGGFADITIETSNSDNIVIGAQVTNAGGDAVSMISANGGAKTGFVHFTELYILNAGQVAGAGIKNGFDCLFGKFEIDNLVINDNQSPTTTVKGFVAAAGTSGRVKRGEVRTTGAGSLGFPVDIRTAGVILDNFRWGVADLTGTLTLAAAATTTLTNDNIKSPGALGGFFLQSVVELIPHNAAARALGGNLVTAIANGSATLSHAGDVSGTAVYRWRVAGCRVGTVAAA